MTLREALDFYEKIYSLLDNNIPEPYTMRHIFVLDFLKKNPNQVIGYVASSVGIVHPSAMTRVVNMLLNNKLATFEFGKDRRERLLSITCYGEKILNDIRTEQLRILSEHFDNGEVKCF